MLLELHQSGQWIEAWRTDNHELARQWCLYNRKFTACRIVLESGSKVYYF